MQKEQKETIGQVCEGKSFIFLCSYIVLQNFCSKDEFNKVIYKGFPILVS